MRLAGALDQRGQAVSLFVLLVLAALIVTTGLVVDGGQKVTASTRAETAAAGASRAAGNAAATRELAGADSTGAAVLAAKAFLAGQPGVQGTVRVAAGRVTVETTSSEPTLFLNVIGIDTVRGDGRAEADIVATKRR